MTSPADQAAPDAAPSPVAAMTTTQRWTLAATGLGLFMIFRDALIVNVALPDIQASFDVGEQGLQWVVAAYSLGMAVFMMSSATIADLHGRCRLYVIGIVVFTCASVVCGLAPSLTVLNLARFVQGLAAATVNVTSLALVSAAFPDPDQKARAIGIWTAIASVATAIGPTLGGLLTQGLGWRSIFLVNVPVGIAAIVLTVRFVVESRDPSDRTLDGLGQVLFVVTIGALAFGVIQAPHNGWLSPLILTLLIGSVVAGAIFVYVEARRRDPMMDVHLFQNSTYATAIATIFVEFFAVYGMLLVVTQYLQNVQGYSPAVAGPIMLPFSAMIIVCSPIAGRLVGRIGSRQPVLVGLVALVIGLVVLLAGIGSWLGFVLIGLGFVGVGAALTLTPITNVAMTTVPPERAGMASGIMSAQRAIGSTIGFAVLGSVLAAWLTATLPSALQDVVPDATTRQEYVDAIVENANPRAVPAELGPQREDIPGDQDAEVIAAADDDFVAGIRVALLVGIAGVVAVFALSYWKLPRGRQGVLTAAEQESATREVAENDSE